MYIYRADLKHLFAIVAVDTTVDGSIELVTSATHFQAALEHIEERFVKK